MKSNNILFSLLHLFLFIFLILCLFFENPLFCLIMVFIQAFFIILKCRVSLFTVMIVLVNFCLLTQYFALTGYIITGVLVVFGVPIYFNELYFCTILFNYIISIFVYNTNCLKNEKVLFSRKIEISPVLQNSLIIASIIITLLVFPSMPSLSSFGNNRFESGILPFGGWSIIPHLFIAITFFSRKRTKFSILAAGFIIFWYVFHGERVDSIGLLVFMALLYYYDNTKNDNRIKRIKIAFYSIFIVLTFIIVGIMRSGIKDFSFSLLLEKILIQDTACDVTYVFNCSVDSLYKGIMFSGYTYKSYVINLIPLVNDPYSFQTYIKNYYYTVGGGLIFAEPIANFGFVFLALFLVLFFITISLLLKYQNCYATFSYTCLTISIFRIMWYGLNYPIISLVYFIPFVIIMNNFLLRKYEYYFKYERKMNDFKDLYKN